MRPWQSRPALPPQPAPSLRPRETRMLSDGSGERSRERCHFHPCHLSAAMSARGRGCPGSASEHDGRPRRRAVPALHRLRAKEARDRAGVAAAIGSKRRNPPRRVPGGLSHSIELPGGPVFSPQSLPAVRPIARRSRPYIAVRPQSCAGGGQAIRCARASPTPASRSSTNPRCTGGRGPGAARYRGA